VNTHQAVNAVEAVEYHCSQLKILAEKLRTKNNRAAMLASKAIQTAQTWLLEAAEEDEANDPFSLNSDTAPDPDHRRDFDNSIRRGDEEAA
jgi:hypothetical protein